MGIDWRYGAEWYECLLVDYDVSSNWANWQYVSGVGNDPRGENRIFNPVKQAFDYDRDITVPAEAGGKTKGGGAYVRMWVPNSKLSRTSRTCSRPPLHRRRNRCDLALPILIWSQIPSNVSNSLSISGHGPSERFVTHGDAASLTQKAHRKLPIGFVGVFPAAWTALLNAPAANR